jgi:hypothetical protein
MTKIPFKITPRLFSRLLWFSGLLFSVSIFFCLSAIKAEAATMSIIPSSGEFRVGETFQASIMLDTEDESINTLETSIIFPADRLQIVSPTAGNSIINIYTTPPKFNNLTGRIDVAGGIPGGITTSKGLITTVTFRAKSSGPASLRFLDNSKALLNNGLGTDAFKSGFGATYKLVLPPPAGPLVTSETHPDQERWYKSTTVIFKWNTEEGVEGYSYEIGEEPISLPDNIVDGRESSVIYKNIGDGVHYFHIKSLRKGNWGGVTHFSFKVDNNPPASFPVEVYPATRTSSARPVIEFITTDQASGMDRYEIKIVPLNQNAQTDQFFIQTTSPYTPERLDQGGYSVIVRAYDKADNFTEVTQRLDINYGIGRFFGLDGLYISRGVYIRWVFLIPSLLLALLILAGLAFYSHRRHHAIEKEIQLPETVKQQLTELQKYRSKYGNMLTLLALFLTCASLFLSAPNSTKAEAAGLDSGAFNSPVITSVSEKITEQEIFYTSGRTSEPNIEVKLHLQSLYDGQSFEFRTVSDKRGDWLYRHNGFLSPGKYIIWGQAQRGNESSAPSAQKTIEVQAVAISLNGTRITLEMVYVGLITILVFAILLLALYLTLILKASRKKREILKGELGRAEEYIKLGFETLRKDLELELSLVKKSGLSGELAGEERIREEQIMADLKNIEKYVSGEILETKAVEGLS